MNIVYFMSADAATATAWNRSVLHLSTLAFTDVNIRNDTANILKSRFVSIQGVVSIKRLEEVIAYTKDCMGTAFELYESDSI